MPSLIVRDMRQDDECYVASCSHVKDPSEATEFTRARQEWMRARRPGGLRVKVALLDGERVGFLYMTPIEISPLGPVGRDMAVMPCLFVDWDYQHKHGLGRAMVEAAEKDARAGGAKALATIAYYGDFWFMPAAWFEKLGYAQASRDGDKAVMWKVFDKSAEAPRLLSPKYAYTPVPGKVAVDLFWMTFCGAADRRDVLKVAGEFGERIVVREFCNDRLETLRRYEIPRALYVNGVEIEWDYEDAERGIREAIRAALPCA